MEEALKLESGEEVDFIVKKEKIELKPGVVVKFYTSALPCGDCQIIESENDEIPAKKRKLAGVTGCPPIGERINDKMNTNQNRGLARIKGGRGVPTDSMSCSDKISRWLKSGVTGSLLENVFVPIFIDEIIIGAAERPTDLDQIKSSLFRLEPSVKPDIYFDSTHFCLSG